MFHTGDMLFGKKNRSIVAAFDEDSMAAATSLNIAIIERSFETALYVNIFIA